MLVGALLIFIGVAMFSSWLVGPLAAGANPVARWAVFLFAILVWPFWSLPYWLLRVGAFGPGSAGTAGRLLRPRRGPEPAAPARRARDADPARR